jgi:hypothetical protein
MTTRGDAGGQALRQCPPSPAFAGAHVRVGAAGRPNARCAGAAEGVDSRHCGARAAFARHRRMQVMDNSTAGALLCIWLLGAPLIFAIVSKFTGR